MRDDTERKENLPPAPPHLTAAEQTQDFRSLTQSAPIVGWKEEDDPDDISSIEIVGDPALHEDEDQNQPPFAKSSNTSVKDKGGKKEGSAGERAGPMSKKTNNANKKRAREQMPDPSKDWSADVNQKAAHFQSRVDRRYAEAVEAFRASTGMSKKEITERALARFFEDQGVSL
ncbi:MAG: hypothetical protein RIC85_03020 [Gammaproteobacteria bacterium]